MRRLAFILLVTLLTLPAAAVAARSDKGFGAFELKSASGTFVLKGDGVLLGQMDKGSLRVQQLTGTGAATPAVSSPPTGPALHTRETSDLSATIYTGTNIHFRVTTGKYSITFRGSGLDLTAVGVGTATMTASSVVANIGEYTLDGTKWVAVPIVRSVVPYGVKTPASNAGP